MPPKPTELNFSFAARLPEPKDADATCPGTGRGVVKRGVIKPIASVFCTRSPLFPPIGGAPLRNRQNLEALKALGTVSLFSIFKGPPSHPSAAVFHSTHFDLNDPQRSCPEKLARRLRWLRPYGHYYTDWIYTGRAAQQFQHCLEQAQPDLIVLEELWLHPYLSVALTYRQGHPGCKIILDSHNVEGLLAPDRGAERGAARGASGKALGDWLKPARWGQALQPRRVRRMERRALETVDQMWVCSPEDAAAMAELYGAKRAGRKLTVIPNGVDLPAYARPERPGQDTPVGAAVGSTASPAASSGAPTLLFLGSYGYRPNRVAARLLLEEIYPRLRDRHPHLRLQLVGSEPTPWMQQAAAQSHGAIEVTGQVESVLPYLHRASALVVPLRQGSGTRLKLLEAFAAGVPVVSTAKGAEGLAVRDGEHLLLREDVGAIAAGVEQILSLPALGQTLATAAQELVSQQYSWEVARQRISAAAEDLVGDRAAAQIDNLLDDPFHPAKAGCVKPKGAT